VRRASLAVTVMLLLLGSAATSCDETRSPPDGGHAPSASNPTTASSPSREARTSPPPTCHVAHTHLAVAWTASEMSQPFADIAITNTGATSCLLKGYPRIQAWGHAGWQNTARRVPLAIVIHHGSIYERTDHGPRPVILQPHRAAFFSVGTAAAYQGGLHPIIITRLSVTLPGTHTPHRLPIELLATRPPGGKIPVGITAIRPTEGYVGGRTRRSSRSSRSAPAPHA
jgi:hypothetical protein